MPEDFVVLPPDRADRRVPEPAITPPVPLGDTPDSPAERDLTLEPREYASRDAYAYINFNPSPGAEERSGELSPVTWAMAVVAGVVLGGVMTLIAAGA
jgi:hypothetical protein